MRRTLLSVLALVALLAAPVQAQDDPFEEILNDPGGIEARLDDVSIPVKNPTKEELRQYLEAFRAINLATTMTLDSGRGKTATLGAFEAPNGTKVSLKASFLKRPGERESVLRTLEVRPSRPMSMGPIRFNRMTLDRKGVLHFKLNLNLMGHDFWPQELTIEKIYRDRSGNLVLKTGGSGLAGTFVPDIRIKPDGTVQHYDKGWWLFGWHGRGWKDVKLGRKKVKLPATLPIKRWPPRASDLLDWMPNEGSPGARDTLDGVRDFLDSIPITNMSTRFEAEADPTTIALSGGNGRVHLRDHGIEIEANGRFEGRTYRTNTNKPNTFKVSGRLAGNLNTPGLGKARIDGASFDLSGTHKTTLPFENLDNVELDARFKARADARLSKLKGELADGARFEASRATADFSGSGRVVVRPLSERNKTRIELNPDNRYRIAVEGKLGMSRLEAPGGMIVSRMELAPGDDPNTLSVDERAGPVMVGEGTLRNEGSVLTSRTDWRLNGVTTNRGAIHVLNGTQDDVAAVTSLRPGATVNVRAKTLVKMRPGGGASVRATADFRVRGTGEHTRIKAGAMESEIPGAVDLDSRFAMGARYTTRDRGGLAIRKAAASTSVNVREEGGTFRVAGPKGSELRGTVRPGTRFSLETGLMTPPTPRSNHLETEGYGEGKKGAKFSARLVLGAGTLAYKKLTVSFNGSTTVDLNAAIGLRLDPNSLLDAEQPRTTSDPIALGLDLAVDFSRGDTIVSDRGGRIARIKLSGATRIEAKATVKVDPVTGVPLLEDLSGIDVNITANGIDLRRILKPLGISSVSINSRTTVRIKKARIQFRRNGLRITHRGISITIAPGTIDIGS